MRAAGKALVMVILGMLVLAGMTPAGAALSARAVSAGAADAPAALQAATLYVANAPATCGANTSCYSDSTDDLADGVGTGLKAAIDAAPAGATIVVLGDANRTYALKSKSVLVNKAVTITGQNDVTITNPACASPMLLVTDGVTITGLNINSSCTSPKPNLIEVNSPSGVKIESNDLRGGANAITVRDNAGPLTVRFNEITGNSGYALYWDAAGGPGTASLSLTANNLTGNRNGAPVNCAAGAASAPANRTANHNFWGGPPPGSADTNCVITPGKELGARILDRVSGPGVTAQIVSVTGDKTAAFRSESFSGEVSYAQSGGGSAFPLYLVYHGYATETDLPFLWKNMEGPSPCSGFYDVFLPEGVAPSGATLNLYIKYNRTLGCDTVISSNKLCDQTSLPGNYPLWWYDPAGNVTGGWDTTGQLPAGTGAGGAAGQTTTCSIGTKEIMVSLDTSGRPGLLGDMGYTPFFTGVPVLRQFLPLASNKTITVTWQTNVEPEIKYFRVLRGTDPDNLTQLGGLISPKGGTSLGAYYSVVDANLNNGTNYYYQLEIYRIDDYVMYSNEMGLAPNIATITPTITQTPRPSITPTPTRTPVTPSPTASPTDVPQQNPTRIPSRTFTVTPTRIGTFFLSASETPLPFLTRTPDLSVTVGTEGPTAEAILTQAGGYPALDETLTPTTSGGTEIAMLGSATPSPSPTGGQTPTVLAGQAAESSGSPWASLLLGILAGSLAVAAVGYFFFRNRSG